VYYAILFLVLGVIAGVLHWAGVAAVTVPMSWVLLATGILLGGNLRDHGAPRSGCVTGMSGCRQVPGVMT